MLVVVGWCEDVMFNWGVGVAWWGVFVDFVGEFGVGVVSGGV